MKKLKKDSKLEILERNKKNALIYRKDADTDKPYVFARGFDGYEWKNGTYFKSKEDAMKYWNTHKDITDAMKKFAVSTNGNEFIVSAKSYDEAIAQVKQTKVFKDSASPYQTINALIEDERSAVELYNVALENLKGKIPDISYQAIVAIRNDENKHIENLQAVINGNVTEKNLEDSMKDDLSDDIKKYQMWVDYDMKRYNKISEITMSALKKAGLKVVKDKYGDYEVIE